MSISFRHIIVAVSVLIASCSSCNSTSKKGKSTSTLKTSTQVTSHDLFSGQNNLEVVKRFADSFQPDSFPYHDIGKLGAVPDSVIYAFKTLRRLDSVSLIHYLTVIFLKLYLDHLRCCHQSYEVRNNYAFAPIDSMSDPLVYEYCLATGILDTKKPIDFIGSRIGDAYVEKNKYLLEYPDIQKLWNELQPVKDSIDKGLYWNADNPH